MRLLTILIFLLTLQPPPAHCQLPPIGQWREHLPWNNAIQVAAKGQEIIAATPYGVFLYDIDGSAFTRRSKVNGLNDIGVSAMALDSVSGKTVVVFRNSNVDVLDGDATINIPDIRISNAPGDKSVSRALARNNTAWLSAGVGVIVLDLNRAEVRATWRPYASGTPSPVFAVALFKDSIYAATREGVRKLSNKDDGSNFRNWQTADAALTTKIDHVLADATQLYAITGNQVRKWDGVKFNPFYMASGQLVSADLSNGQLLVGQTQNGRGSVVQLNAQGTIVTTYRQNDLSLPKQCLLRDGSLWVADQNNGLLQIRGNAAERVFPNSPINTALGEMKMIGNTIWATAGTVNEAWNYQFNPNGIYAFDGNEWIGYNLYAYPKIDSLLDMITIAGQPSTGSVFAGSYGGGLLEITASGQLNIYKQNSPLQQAVGDPGSYRVSGLATDASGNIWIANFGGIRNLHVRKADGGWLSFSVPFFISENAVSQITIDAYDQKWIVSPKGNGLLLLNSGQNIDNPNDDRWRYFRQGRGLGNLPSNVVYCTVQDKNGFVWVGTDKGIAVITCGQDASASNCDAVIPIVQQDNFAGFLFQDEQVICMAVDGANRKWVGTRNGLWLISSDGEKVITQFTKDNSPLLANEISSLAIHPVTGEVFVGTSAGICSFRGTATDGADKASSVLVFPNPVPPGYSGTIGIRGLANNALVRITEQDGRLVYQTRAQGGQATWNGKDQKGNRPSSGVYLVFASDEQNVERIVSKIFFIR
jgi:ligand-binding sensor domain-containing protein